MNYVAFRDSSLARKLVDRIRRSAAGLGPTRIMEVCGTHTMEIGRLGLRPLLPPNVKLVSGPGCPVCVTPGGVIDAAAKLSLLPQTCVVTFGDMIRVPGNESSLQQARTLGGRVEVVTSPAGMLELAAEHPGVEHVFIGVGFETTIPSVARVILQARERKLGNCSLLVAHRLVPPALEALIADPAIGVSGFLLPGHVSAILGVAAYGGLVERGIPGVITGFEPLDILLGICTLLELIAEGKAAVLNRYARVAGDSGNPRARELITMVFSAVDAVWRGLGGIRRSGLVLREEFESLDAERKFGLRIDGGDMPGSCSCGEVLRGLLAPDECPLFGRQCTPENPFGPCMVSVEGSCAAYYRYGG